MGVRFYHSLFKILLTFPTSLRKIFEQSFCLGLQSPWLPHPLTLFLLPVTHWLPYQGLCTCWSLVLECSSLTYLSLLQVSAPASLLRLALSLTPSANSPLPVTLDLIFLLYFLLLVFSPAFTTCSSLLIVWLPN